MNYLFLFLTVIITTPESIQWRKLSWNDFNGSVSSGAAASTATEISFQTKEKGGRYYFTATALFAPKSSFTTTKSEKTLRHEQLHFDITELFARKINKEIEKYQGGSYQDCARAGVIYDSLCTLWDRMEEDYDRETEHSMNEGAQKRWENYVCGELKINQ